MNCPIKGVSDDCEKCSEDYYETCVYVTTWKYIRSEEFRKDKGRPWNPSEFLTDSESLATQDDEK